MRNIEILLYVPFNIWIQCPRTSSNSRVHNGVSQYWNLFFNSVNSNLQSDRDFRLDHY